MFITSFCGVTCAAVVLGFSSTAETITAAQVASRLREKIMSQWKVEGLEVSVVPYSQADTDRGRFKTVSVRAESATRDGITLKPMWVKGTDVVFDLSALFGPQFRVQTKSRGTTEMYLVLAEEDLNTGLKMAQNVVPDLHATLADGQITLTGTYKFVVGNKFRMSGRLEVKDGYKINFVPTAAKVNGVPLPISGVRVLLSRLNPLLDLSQVIMQPRIRSLTLENGRLIAR
ncbi:MAG: LmeA family phospholipid-binding protein [Candidatus Zipacnadales bacterium]